MAAANAHQAACTHANEVLDALSAEQTAVLMEKCDGIVFLWTVKAGLVVGASHGHGFYLRRLGEGRWTAPLFVSATAASAGAILGYEKVSTVMAAKTQALADELLAGRHPILGADVSMQLLSAKQTAPEVYNMNTVLPATEDLVSVSVASGLCLNVSLTGGGMTVDEGQNAEVYGAGATAHAILSGEVASPAEMSTLYDRLNSIIHWGAGAQ